MKKSIIFLLLLCMATLLSADIIRPAYLQVKEFKSNHYKLLLKLPVKGTKRLPIKAVLPQECITIRPLSTHFVNGAYLERWSVKCKDGLIGKTVTLKGLRETDTDVLLRLEFLDHSSQSILLTSTKTAYTIPQNPSALQIVKTYTWLGITHILLGFDHLLFVFCLLLIVKGRRRLLWTITAFTLAHSLTMAGATLGIVTIAQAPVEAIIALSILFLSIEIIHEKQGKRGLTSRYPWIIAFIFGLLHGFGFAGALAEIGLPEQAIGIALLFFNIGVELGQLVFVATVLLLGVLVQRLAHPSFFQKVETIGVYAIGTISSFWLIERVSSF